MNFTGNEGEELPLDIAAKWTANYRAQNLKGIKAYFFGEKNLRKILSQKHCIGLRVYNGIDELGVQQMIIVGTDAKGNDLCNGIVLDRAIPCPPFCDDGSPLCK
jgi:hypothetical protein